MGKRAEIMGWYRMARRIGLPRLFSFHAALIAGKRIDLGAALLPLPEPDELKVASEYVDTQREQAGMQ